MVAVPHNGRFDRNDAGPFVTALLWAETDGAAKRAKLMEIEADDPGAASSAPRDLLPGPATTYGDIARTLEQQGRAFQEYAEYRVARDGAFIHRTIEAAPYAFFFRKLEHDDSDRCYAIRFTLAE